MSDVALDLDSLDFEKGGGLVTVVCQDSSTGAVLMVAHADRDALEQTMRSGEMHYRSRSRGPWHKGATSGNVQRVVSLHADCDGDAVLARVQPAGPACHSGSMSCFGAASESGTAMARLSQVIERRRQEPVAGSYTNRLLADRNLRMKKLGEECAELILACADGDSVRATEEAADVLYHTLVALSAQGCSLADIERVLNDRVRE